MKNMKNMKKITSVLGENFVGIYTARPKFFYETTVVVVKKNPFSALQTITSELKKENYILLSEKEILDSSDVFPLQFLVISQTKQLIVGEDIFEKISLELSDIRRKLEYDLRNKNIYLRQESLNIPAKKLLQNILPELFPAFLALGYLLKREGEFSEYSAHEFRKFLENIQDLPLFKGESLSVFINILRADISNCTEKESFAILKKISISLEEMADWVNEL